jgi:predicted enzyme related to lactoylglutathione lyase
MGAPVVHFEITTGGDLAECQQFYRDLFDWEIDASNPMQYGVVRTNAGKGIDGGISAPEPGASAAITFYVEVPEIDATLAEVESKGGKVLMPRTVLPGMVTLGIFSDPQGNVVGLVEPDIVPA